MMAAMEAAAAAVAMMMTILEFGVAITIVTCRALLLGTRLLQLRELCLDLLLLRLSLHILATARLDLVIHGDIGTIVGYIKD